VDYLTNLKTNKIMEYLKCTKCGEEAHNFKEFANGKCRLCGGELEEETGDELTARDMGMDSEL
jgi:ribosomal protein S27E